MKFKKNFKKGFTLVELIVVIAIVAILAAVSVVSYVSFIGAANTSADQQAVTQMNRILMADSILNEDSNIYDLYAVLENNGLTAKDYKPLMKDRYFFWDKKENRIVYTDKDYQVLYPADLAHATKDDGWYSLTNEITQKSYDIAPVPETIGDKQYKSITVSEAGEFTKIAQDIKNGLNGNFPYGYVLGSATTKDSGYAKGVVGTKANPINIRIKLDVDEIDMMGGVFNFSAKWCNIIIEGKETGTTISNIVNGDNFGYAHNKEGGISAYGAGLLGYVYDSNVTIRNITVKDCYFGTDKYDLVGAGIVGFYNSTDDTHTCEFENVKVINNYNVGHHGTAAFIGKVGPGSNKTTTINFKGQNKVINCNNISTEKGKLFAAGAVGEIQPSGGEVIINASADTLSVENTTSVHQDGSLGATFFAMRDDTPNSNYNNLQVNALENYNQFKFSQTNGCVKSTSN